jgi:hypothetical protein
MSECSGRIELLRKCIQESPIVYASIHGVYDLSEELEEPVILPANVIVIEMADIGEITLTSIDRVLWDVMQNRELFKMLVLGELTEELISPMLKAMHVYMPGDTLYKRKLIYEPENQFDNRWALYKFDPRTTGIPFPKNHGTAAAALGELTTDTFKKVSDDFLRGIKASLYKVERPEGASLRSGEKIATGRNLKYSQVSFIRDCQREYGDAPTIYIISACASLWTEGKKSIQAELVKDHLLSENQRNVDLKNYECGTTTHSFQDGSAGASVMLPVPGATVQAPSLRSGVAKAATSGWTESFAPSGIYKDPRTSFTGNTPEARRLLEAASVTREPRLGNLNGDMVLLFIKDPSGKYTPLLKDGSRRANFTRSEAEALKLRDLYTVTRGENGLPKYTNFTTRGGKRSRRILKKSKKTLKYKKTRRSL